MEQNLLLLLMHVKMNVSSFVRKSTAIKIANNLWMWIVCTAIEEHYCKFSYFLSKFVQERKNLLLEVYSTKSGVERSKDGNWKEWKGFESTIFDDCSVVLYNIKLFQWITMHKTLWIHHKESFSLSVSSCSWIKSKLKPNSVSTKRCLPEKNLQYQLDTKH